MDTTVFDGGALMHHVFWPKLKKDKPPPLVRDIVKLYADKVMKESSTSEDIVVFDGYDSSAKDHCICRLLRSPTRSLQIDLDWNTPVTTQNQLPTTTLGQDTAFLQSDQLWPIKYQLSMSPHIIGPVLLFLVTQGTYGDIMVRELVCRLHVLGLALYVQCARFNSLITF